MSFQAAPRKPVVTQREGVKLRVMADMIPLTAEEHGARNLRSFGVTVSTDRFGFQSARAGWELTSAKARPVSVTVPTEGQEAREAVGEVWVNYDGHVMRTVEMGDARLPKLPKITPDDSPEAVTERKARSAARKAAGMDRSEDRAPRTGPSEAYLRAVASHISGKPYTGPITGKMRAMILDVISNQESVARYVNGK